MGAIISVAAFTITIAVASTGRPFSLGRDPAKLELFSLLLFVDALVEKGYISSRDEGFSDLLNDGGPAYVERRRLTAAEAIHLARASRAVPVIAHPVTMGLTRETYAEAFHQLTDLGLGGIEAHHPMHDVGLRAHLTEIAAALGIAATGGSDYHGATKRAYRVGVGNGDLRVPESAVEQLHAQRDR